jgi:uncharacterized low-complexity protein
MPKKTLTPIAAVVGAALAGGLSAVSVADAADNPFGLSQLDRGYMLLASDDTGTESGDGTEGEGKGGGEMKCGEGKCGSTG